MLPLAEASCRQLLNHMDAGDESLEFGDRQDPSVDVVLPMSLVSSMYHIYHVGQDVGGH